MSLLPITSNRVSTPLQTQRLLFQLNSDQLALQRHYEQLSTGRRIASVADDPAAAGRVVLLNRDINRAQQVIRNANATETYYQAADTSLSAVDNALIEARAAAVEGAQNVIGEDVRRSLTTTLDRTIQTLVSSGNTLFRDHQMLGGVLGDGTPYEFDGASVVFQGTAAVGQTKLAEGTLAPINVTGGEALGSGMVFFEGAPLGAAVDADTRLIDLRGGRGVDAGLIRISGGGNFIEVDLSGAHTIGDVVDVLSATEIDGRFLTASLAPDGISVRYADGIGGTLAIADPPGGETADQLGIANPLGIQVPPLVGDGLTPRVTLNTAIAELDGGAGIDLTGGIRIERGGEAFDINLDDARTLGDVVIAINRSGANVRAELDEAEGRLRLRSLRFGVDYSVGENGGTAAANLGIRTATTRTRLDELGKTAGVLRNTGGTDVVIRRPDGVELELNLDDAETIGDVIDLIRNHPDNQDASKVLVDLAVVGNGLTLRAPPGADPMTVRQVGFSDAGTRLGWIPRGDAEAVGEVIAAFDEIGGADYAPLDAGGAMDTLLRLKTAIAEADLPEISRLQARLDEDFDRATQTRGRIGVRQQNLQELREAAEDRTLAFEAQRSEEYDADIASVISDISQRQTALEASMRLIGQVSRLTVLNYL